MQDGIREVMRRKLIGSVTYSELQIVSFELPSVLVSLMTAC